MSMHGQRHCNVASFVRLDARCSQKAVVCLVSFKTRIDFIDRLPFLLVTLEDFSRWGVRGENYVYVSRLIIIMDMTHLSSSSGEILREQKKSRGRS